MKDVKARLHPTPALQKAVDEYAEEKIKDIQSRAYEAVMKERNDIAMQAKKPDKAAALKPRIKSIEQCVREAAALDISYGQYVQRGYDKE